MISSGQFSWLLFVGMNMWMQDTNGIVLKVVAPHLHHFYSLNLSHLLRAPDTQLPSEDNKNVLSALTTPVSLPSDYRKCYNAASVIPSTSICRKAIWKPIFSWLFVQTTKFTNHTHLQNQLKHALHIAKQQVFSQVQEYEEALQTLATAVYWNLIYFLRNLFGMYALIASLLIPYYVKHLELLNSVPLNDPYLLNFYGLPENANPRSFGLDFLDVEIHSSVDESIVLSGWFVPCLNTLSKKAVLCLHGSFANRQACLKFLDLAKQLGLLRQHHFFLLDMRNSGASSSSRTDLNAKCAADIFDVAQYLREKVGLEELTIFGQSTGALIALIFANSFGDRLNSLGIRLESLILDSPICSIPALLRTNPLSAFLRQWFSWSYYILLWILNRRCGGQLHRMRASCLLRSLAPKNVLVLQAKSDHIAPTDILMDEMRATNSAYRPKNVYIFEKGQHSDILSDNINDYGKIIKNHFKRNHFLSFLSIDRKLSNFVRRIEPKEFD